MSAASRFDVSRNRKQLDDGHLSSIQRKRELRGMLLNESKLAAKLTSFRVLTGYDAKYSDHCTRYKFKYHVELRRDGVPSRLRRHR